MHQSRLLSCLLLLVAIAGCNDGFEPDSCLAVAEGWVPSRPEYIVMFKEGVPAQPTTNDLVTKYNLELRIQFAGDNGFSATVPTFAAFEGLRCEPIVAVMGWNAVVIPHGDP